MDGEVVLNQALSSQLLTCMQNMGFSSTAGCAAKPRIEAVYAGLAVQAAGAAAPASAEEADRLETGATTC